MISLSKHTLTFTLGAALVLIALLVVFILGGTTPNAKAAAGAIPATIATSSLAAVNTTASAVIATSTCSARIISTATSSVMITFSDYAGQSPSDTFGHWQAASTTVAYDGAIYGCGLVKVWSQAAQRITVTDSR